MLMAAPPDLRRIRAGLTYEAYRSDWQAELDHLPKGVDKTTRKYWYYKKYNWERAERVRAAYEMSPGLREALASVEEPQLWLVLTEAWCVDSAYSLPIIAAAVQASPSVDLRILPRDENLDLMDQYLTNGGRSIPKLVAFGEDGTERFRWGPRPEPAQTLRARMKEGGASGAELSQAVITWYEASNWQVVDAELGACVLASLPLRPAKK